MSHQPPTEKDSVVVEVGHEDLEHGRVRAELGADGALTVTKVYEGKSDHFEGRVDKESAEETIRRADDLARIAPREDSRYQPVPDEALYRIELLRAGDEPLVLEIWQNQLDENEEARRLVQQLGQQVTRASDGQAVL